MCGILALVSLGATIDCLLAHAGGEGGGSDGADSCAEGHDALNVPHEVSRLFAPLYRRGPDGGGRFLFCDLPCAQVV